MAGRPQVFHPGFHGAKASKAGRCAMVAHAIIQPLIMGSPNSLSRAYK